MSNISWLSLEKLDINLTPSQSTVDYGALRNIINILDNRKACCNDKSKTDEHKTWWSASNLN